MNRRQEQRRELWRQIIAQQGQSGQSIRAFCKSHGVGEHSFYTWRMRLREESTPVQFALVKTEPAGGAQAQPIEVVLAGGERLRIACDAATLRLVLSVLREQ